MNEEKTPGLNPPNIKEEITGDEEHTSAPEVLTIVIETTDQSEVPESVEPPSRGSRNSPKTEFFVHNIMVTQVTRRPEAETRIENNQRDWETKLRQDADKKSVNNVPVAKTISCSENTSLLLLLYFLSYY